MSYDPRLYELLHRGTPKDVDTYAERLEGARRVLELGCGFGRVLEALAGRRPELELVGIDNHSGLLERARARVPPSVRLLDADMRSFQLDGLFDAVIAPYSTLWCLQSEADFAACLERVFAHLAPGGRFFFDAYAADRFGAFDPEDEDEGLELVAEVEEDGEAYRIFEQAKWLPGESGFSVTYHYEPIGGGPTRYGHIHHRYRTSDELIAALGQAGFVNVQLECGFEGLPFDVEDEHLFGHAARPLP